MKSEPSAPCATPDLHPTSGPDAVERGEPVIVQNSLRSSKKQGCLFDLWNEGHVVSTVRLIQIVERLVVVLVLHVRKIALAVSVVDLIAEVYTYCVADNDFCIATRDPEVLNDQAVVLPLR